MALPPAAPRAASLRSYLRPSLAPNLRARSLAGLTFAQPRKRAQRPWGAAIATSAGQPGPAQGSLPDPERPPTHPPPLHHNHHQPGAPGAPPRHFLLFRTYFAPITIGDNITSQPVWRLAGPAGKASHQPKCGGSREHQKHCGSGTVGKTSPVREFQG